MKNRKKNFLHVKSISETNRMLGLGKPLHPLVTIIRRWPEVDFSNTTLTGDLYLISLKGSITGSFGYGRNSYDFEEGTMTFLAPDQALQFAEATDTPNEEDTWTIIFHPDLLLGSELFHKIKEYSFFDYDTNEGLHLSQKEKEALSLLVDSIDEELQHNIDRHSQKLIISNLETLLTYCLRFYERQFYTRTNFNKSIVPKFNQVLKEYFDAGKGIPTVALCGTELNMSANYLSDLLKIETGKSAKDHIHDYVIDKAKNLLLISNNNVNEIAYYLGFRYPQHFSKLFKHKTGMSPSKFRTLN